ncbi:MAG: hypothetical protein V3S55_13950 [Nitrospiraceae bacterium]
MFEALILWYIEKVYYDILIALGVIGAILLLAFAYALWRAADNGE